MTEETYTPLASFDLNPSLNDLLWEETTKRSIEDCNSISALKEMANLLLKLATQRQTVIRGLVKDIKLFNHVTVNPDDLANPPIKK